MPYIVATPQKMRECEICGRDVTGTGRTICYYCEMETTPQIREILRDKRKNVPDV